MRFKIPAKQPSSFGSSARYLAGLTKGVRPDRVEWVFGNKLHTLEPNAAAAIMDATAARNSRCQNPVYHFVITFDPTDARRGKVNPDIMRDIAKDVIKRMGLGEYQAMVYAHKDTQHPHMHFLVNRIHPELNKALSRHNDGKRLTELCREIARERGLNIPKDRARMMEKERVDDFDLPAPTEGEYWQAKKERREGDRPFTKQQILALRQDLRPMFFEAKNWNGLSEKLTERGFYLVPKGQGLMITDGRGYMKLSDLHNRDIRLPVLNERYGERFQDWIGRQADRRIKDEDKDLPEPPKLDGLSKDQQSRAKEIHKARIEAIRGRRNLEKQRGDPIVVLDAADTEMRYWQQIQESYVWAERRIETERKREAYQANRAEWAQTRASVQEGRLFESMAKVFDNVEEAHAKWQALEKEKGSTMALEMLLKQPHLVGRMRGMGFFVLADKERLAAERALRKMLETRRKWNLAKDKLEAVRSRQQTHAQAIRKAIKDYQFLQRTAGSKERLHAILLEKVKLRARAMERVTPRMLERANLADRRLRELQKSFREYNERKRDKDRKRQLEKDLWGRDR